MVSCLVAFIIVANGYSKLQTTGDFEMSRSKFSTLYQIAYGVKPPSTEQLIIDDSSLKDGVIVRLGYDTIALFQRCSGRLINWQTSIQPSTKSENKDLPDGQLLDMSREFIKAAIGETDIVIRIRNRDEGHVALLEGEYLYKGIPFSPNPNGISLKVDATNGSVISMVIPRCPDKPRSTETKVRKEDAADQVGIRLANKHLNHVIYAEEAPKTVIEGYHDCYNNPNSYPSEIAYCHRYLVGNKDSKGQDSGFRVDVVQNAIDGTTMRELSYQGSVIETGKQVALESDKWPNRAGLITVYSGRKKLSVRASLRAIGPQSEVVTSDKEAVFKIGNSYRHVFYNSKAKLLWSLGPKGKGYARPSKPLSDILDKI